MDDRTTVQNSQITPSIPTTKHKIVLDVRSLGAVGEGIMQ